MLKTRIHVFFNKMVAQQFNLKEKRSDINPPYRLKGMLAEDPLESCLEEPVLNFRYYIDSTGNNHPVVS